MKNEPGQHRVTGNDDRFSSWQKDKSQTITDDVIQYRTLQDFYVVQFASLTDKISVGIFSSSVGMNAPDQLFFAATQH